MIYEPPTQQIQVLLEVEAQALVLRDALHETTTSLAAVTNLFHGRATMAQSRIHLKSGYIFRFF